ncbi:QRFP-like peptide receptor [Anoplophora glabripennis]|uniref:QRFP-like peptide receptor n=1 Tax=Anoplophora glabripennis TaxID=217634 RepID=UPI000874549D|nr:QRFP-like peptide receptor [Anoplophora glabripennis]XP_023313158.1 QRFP-like peptide receptor [Anoplophora glabripennis]
MSKTFKQNLPIVLNSTIHVVPENTRHAFYWLILVITILAVIGNVLAIRSIILRKCKFLQKTCIISLAMADIFSVVIFATNNLETLSQTLIIWTLGEFMCNFIPMGQVLGTTASSVALLVIALDRYQNVIYALGRRWDPKPTMCILIASALWIVCTVISYPMYIYFQHKSVNVVYVEEEPVFEFAYMCVAVDKTRLTVYYVTMAVLIFLPIIVIFFWFYYKIAALVWKHRKPLALRFNKSDRQSELEESSTTKSTDLSANNSKNLKLIVKKVKNVQVERKIRTFKIVLVLMITFITCRLPYWCFYVIKLLSILKGDLVWNLNFALTALNMINSVLNPLLYTFLSQTIHAWKLINDFICKICCCCFSNAEFEDFEKDNPFVREHHGSKKPQVIKEYPKDTRNPKVKFAGAVPFVELQSSQSIQKY